jgi:hypothetical protein
VLGPKAELDMSWGYVRMLVAVQKEEGIVESTFCALGCRFWVSGAAGMLEVDGPESNRVDEAAR